MKKTVIATLLLAAIVSFGFTTLSSTGEQAGKMKKAPVTNWWVGDLATLSGTSTQVTVIVTVEKNVGTIYAVDFEDQSSFPCLQYYGEAVQSGYIYYSGGNYYASNLVISSVSGSVTLNGELSTQLYCVEE